MAQPIQLYPDGEERRRIMDFIMAAGQTLLENGAEVFRAEQTMQIMARSLHLREFHVYVLTNGIFASAGTAEISEVRNVPQRTIHLGAGGRRPMSCPGSWRQGRWAWTKPSGALVAARRIPFPNVKAQVLSGTVGSAAFALMFGGGLGGSCGRRRCGLPGQPLLMDLPAAAGVVPQADGVGADHSGVHRGVRGAGGQRQPCGPSAR